ncbi:MAG: ABC transporter permease [Acidimicrobiia bacterium]
MFQSARDSRPSWEFFVLLGMILVGWDLVVRIGDVHPIILPAPSAVLQSLFETPMDYLKHGLISLGEMVLGFVFGFLVGFGASVGIFYVPFLRRSVYPLLLSFRIVPKVAFLPLFLVWFGVGIGTKVILAGFAIFFLVLVQTLLGLSTVEPEAIEFGRSLKMSEAAIFRKIRLPSALPAIMVGVKLGITYALTNVVVAEMLVAREGLGFLVVEAKTSLDTAHLIATIVVVTIIGLFLYAIGVTVERRTTAWYAEEG